MVDRTPGEPGAALIIPVRDGGRAFVACLQSVALLDPAPTEVIVVDDAGGDDSAGEAERRGYRVVHRARCGGPSAARNDGARAAQAELLLFADADVTVRPDHLARIRAVFRDDPTLTALIGSYDDDPAEQGLITRYRNLLHHWTHQNARREAFTFWGACGAIRREAFLVVGGFDEHYGSPAIEDIELGYRLKHAGHRIRLVPELQVKHLKRWTLGSMLRTDLLARAIPWTQLILREGKAEDDLNLDLGSRLSVILSGLMLAALVVAPFKPLLLAVALMCAVCLTIVNRRLYAFFLRSSGPVFTLGAVPLHWLYFVYGGVGFAVGWLLHLSRRGRPAARNPGAVGGLANGSRKVTP